MRKVFCAMVFSVACAAQTATGDIGSILVSMQNPDASRSALSAKLSNAIVTLAPVSHKPKRDVVAVFAAELTRDIAGRKLSSAEVAGIARAIVELTGGSVPNFESASHFRLALAPTGLAAPGIQTLTLRFIAVGESVRGIDDSPLLRDFQAK